MAEDWGTADTAVGAGLAAVSLTGALAPVAALMGGLYALAKKLDSLKISATPEQARAYLAVDRIVPALHLYDVRRQSQDPSGLAATVNYLRLRSGAVPAPPGADLSEVDVLHVCDDAALGPVICASDPADPLTAAAFWQDVVTRANAHQDAPSSVTTAAGARALLALLRVAAADGSLKWVLDPAAQGVYVVDTPEFTRLTALLPARVAELRRLAGEWGPDAQLAAALGGPVTTYVPGGLPDGVYLKGSTDPVYVSRGGALHWVPSPAALAALGESGARVQTLPDATIAALPVGPAVRYSGGRWVVPSGVAEDLTWWWVGGAALAAAFVGGAAWLSRRHASGRLLTLTTTGEDTYRRVLREGVVDGELGGGRDAADPELRRAFARARNFGITPTDLAASGRYFGEAVFPIRVEVHPGGRLHLSAGREQYAAAKAAGARAILADVVRLDGRGAVVEGVRQPVRLV